MTRGYVPPGWPAEVLPVDVEGWERTAADWLLDHGDPVWRLDETLTRQVLVLAGFARQHARAQVDAAREMWRTVPVLEADGMPGAVGAAVRDMLEREGQRLVQRQHAVDLVAEALRGQRWNARL